MASSGHKKCGQWLACYVGPHRAAEHDGATSHAFAKLCGRYCPTTHNGTCLWPVCCVVSKSLMKGLACRPYVLPERYVVPLVPGDYNTIDRPRGMLFVTVVSAQNVPKMDWFNGSDPYVRYPCTSK